MYHDEILTRLEEQIARKKRLERQKEKLRERVEELEARTIELNEIMLKEESDVEKLEGGTFVAFFYKMLGTHSEKLSDEQREAYEAKLKYEAAESELKALKDDIYDIDKELGELFGVEDRYEQALSLKNQSLIISDKGKEEEIFRISKQISELNAKKKELQEAIAAGARARGSADRILACLEQAEEWGKADMWGVGGIITEIGKHSNLSDAQSRVEQLQIDLSRFKNELADVNVASGVTLETEGYVKFADWFFDSFFANWEMQKRIENSNHNVWKVKREIDMIIEKLNARLSRIEEEKRTLKASIEEIVKEIK